MILISILELQRWLMNYIRSPRRSSELIMKWLMVFFSNYLLASDRRCKWLITVVVFNSRLHSKMLRPDLPRSSRPTAGGGEV